MPRYDAILAPGGGLDAEGTPPPYVAARLDRVLELEQGEPILLLSAGTTHKPLTLDKEGRPIFEAVASARYLAGRGIDPGRLFAETCSYDTIGNAFFSRVIHAGPANWRKLLVVNSEFHMARTEFIFRWIYALQPDGEYDLSFEPTGNRGMAESVLAVRRERERQSLEKVSQTARKLKTLASVHEWLFTRHAAYAPFCPSGDPPLDERITETY